MSAISALMMIPVKVCKRIVQSALSKLQVVHGGSISKTGTTE